MSDMLTRTILPNLRTRLVAVIFLALLPAFVLLITIAALERTRAQESAKLESMALAQLLRTQYEEVITNSRTSLQWLARAPEIIGDGRRSLFCAAPASFTKREQASSWA